jgi:phosphoribosylformylglycinamidine cyclo-ligase
VARADRSAYGGGGRELLTGHGGGLVERDAYREAGVDIAAGDAFVERIKPLAASTRRDGVVSGLGGFGGLFAVPRHYRDPILVSGTDGVGTKLLVASAVGRHDTIGIDLVAMCVNDIAVAGAEPLFFLDYFATSKLNSDQATAVVSGIAEGCRQAGAALLGGETAEMPGLYQPGHYDLAGFAVGVVERDDVLDGRHVRPGHALIGVPGNGLHSNGYSLVRKLLIDSARFDLDADPGGLGHSLGHELLRPTRIYARELLGWRPLGVHAAAHITGGGLIENTPRMLPEGMGAELIRDSWVIPPIFQLLAREGNLSEVELLRTFNCGIGLVLATPEDSVEALCEATNGTRIGTVMDQPGVVLR